MEITRGAVAILRLAGIYGPGRNALATLRAGSARRIVKPGQVVNRIHDCLRQLADRPIPNGHVRDEDDELRLIERVLDWDGYVRLAFDEIRLAAGGYPQVTRRLEAALADLKTVAPARRQPALDRQLRLLERGVAHALEDENDRRAALVADAQGIGSGADVAIR